MSFSKWIKDEKYNGIYVYNLFNLILMSPCRLQLVIWWSCPLITGHQLGCYPKADAQNTSKDLSGSPLVASFIASQVPEHLLIWFYITRLPWPSWWDMRKTDSARSPVWDLVLEIWPCHRKVPSPLGRQWLTEFLKSKPHSTIFIVF